MCFRSISVRPFVALVETSRKIVITNPLHTSRISNGRAHLNHFNFASVSARVFPLRSFSPSKKLDSIHGQSFAGLVSKRALPKSKDGDCSFVREAGYVGRTTTISNFVADRSDSPYLNRWYSSSRSASAQTEIARRKKKWTREEDEKLREAVGTYGGGKGSWGRIAAAVGTRTLLQAWNRWFRVLSSKSKEAKWTPNEDTKLMDAVQKYGEGNWAQMAKDLEGRTHSQCSYRWTFVLSPLNKKGQWTDEEDKQLAAAFAKHGAEWSLIASEVKGRNAMMCRQRWNRTLNPPLKSGNWTQDEDKALRKAIETHGGDWQAIAAGVSGRSQAQCYVRWHSSLSPDIKRGKWSHNEDQKLRGAVAKHGVGNWLSIAAEMNGRTGRQCRVRWHESISPDIKNGSWTADEDQNLRNAVTRHGVGKWSVVAKEMSGRTPFKCRERWHLALSPNIKRGMWANEEDMKLRDAVAKHGVGKWCVIANEMSGRTRLQCRKRWFSALASNVKRGIWTKEEDQKLRDAVARHGLGSWTAICADMDGRSRHSCRIRWIQTLSPNIVRKRWSAEEDVMLREAVGRRGAGNWSLIAPEVSGRAPHQCFNRWRYLLKLGRVSA